MVNESFRRWCSRENFAGPVVKEAQIAAVAHPAENITD
jgi:hypothetical protein